LPKSVLSDVTIELTGFYPRQYYPKYLRLVRYWDEKQKLTLLFLTNAMHISALQVAELYKNRWQVELFFKWLKQHLRIKKFWGTTENAVRIQIYVAICTYCLVAIVQNDMQLDRSTYEVLQILSISLTDKTHLMDLFERTKFQNINERFRLNEPNLFNF
jgi:transposase